MIDISANIMFGLETQNRPQSYRAVLSVQSGGREVVWRGGGAATRGGHGGGRLAELGVALLERRSSLAR